MAKVKNFETCKVVGDWFFTNSTVDQYRRLSFLCPCGCGSLAGIRVRNDGKQDEKAWGWNLNEDKPTVTPSIRINDEEWHGHLVDGVFISCKN